MHPYKLEKVSLRLLIYGFVTLYVVLDLWLGGPLWKRAQGMRAGSEVSQNEGIENEWAARINGFPITSAQLDAAVQLRLARTGETGQEMTDGNRMQIRLSTLKGLILDELAHRWFLHPANQETTPETFIQQHVEGIEGMLAPETLTRLTETHGLTPQKRRELLGLHARHTWWVEQKISEALPVREEDIRDHYEAWKEHLVIPEVIRARHIFLSTVNDNSQARANLIQDIYRRLQGGESFEDLASRHSEDARTKSTGGDLGFFTARRMPPAFEEHVSGQSVGHVTVPFRTDIGWHIVEVTEHHPSRLASYEEMHDELALWLENLQRADAAARFEKQIRSRAFCREEKFPYAAISAKNSEDAPPADS